MVTYFHSLVQPIASKSYRLSESLDDLGLSSTITISPIDTAAMRMRMDQRSDSMARHAHRSAV